MAPVTMGSAVDKRPYWPDITGIAVSSFPRSMSLVCWLLQMAYIATLQLIPIK